MRRGCRRAKLPRQAGAAILTAMLTVVLVATLAATALWQQWRGIEIEAAQRTRVQSAWVLTGALDWARLILREDARKGGADHLAEPWAVPLEQARLSTFLAADRSDALAAEASQEAFLSGRIVDLQSRLNVSNLLLDGKVHAPSLLAFRRLFELLGVSDRELAALVSNLKLAQGDAAARAPAMAASATPAPANEPAFATNAPLWPQDLAQLAWLGLSTRSLAVLHPFVTVLPARTPVNLNTAPVEVVYACIEAFEMADAHRLVAARTVTHLATLDEAAKAGGNAAALFDAAQHSVGTRFFEILGRLQVAQDVVVEQTLVQREGLEVRTLWRRRGNQPVVAALQ
jgi:general secretion pathway protein K